MDTEIELLKQIYLNKGIYVRSLARKLKLGIPSVKYGLNKLIKKKLITSKTEGRNLKFYINYNNPLIIPSLYNIEYSRFVKLPKQVPQAIFDFLKSLKNKPILTLIFGSYANNTFNSKSDLDILIVFNNIEKNIEEKANIIFGSYNVNIQPIYIIWEEFIKKFHDNSDTFMKQVKANNILINGIEWFVFLKREIS